MTPIPVLRKIFGLLFICLWIFTLAKAEGGNTPGVLNKKATVSHVHRYYNNAYVNTIGSTTVHVVLPAMVSAATR